MSGTKSRLAAALTVAAVAATPAVGALAPSAIAKTTVKPKAGQLCKAHKAKAPKGFKCVKDKKGKYRLKKV